MSPKDFDNQDRVKYSPGEPQEPETRSRSSSVDTEGSSEEGIIPEAEEDEPAQDTHGVAATPKDTRDAVEKDSGAAVSLKRGRDGEPMSGVALSLDSLVVGGQYDVLDKSNRWCEGEIIKIDREQQRVYVTYIYWSSKFDEWVSDVPNRIAPLHTHTYTDNGTLKTGQRVEVLDEKQKWLEAFVIDENEEQVKIHYKGYHERFDEWIDRNRAHERIQPFGRAKSRELGFVLRNKNAVQWGARFNFVQPLTQQPITSTYELVGGEGEKENVRPSSASSSLNEQHRVRYFDNVEERQRKIVDNSTQFLHYQTALERQSLSLVKVRGDGNCLFRAVSQQIYGDEMHHALVREKCLDYMESESAFFSQFVVGGQSMFPLYLQAKRMDACWGDDPEIEALCEIYNRPAEIWTYDSERGAKKLRTFHENVHALNMRTSSSSSSSSYSSSSVLARDRMRPMRLSYYGGGHYDSITERDQVRGLETKRPGEIEDAAIERSRRRVARGRGRDEESGSSRRDSEREREQAELDAALRESRRLATLSEHEDLETSLARSLHDFSSFSQVNSISGGGGLATQGGESEAVLLAASQHALLEHVQRESEEEFIERALVESLAAQTRTDHPLDEETQLQQALLQSQQVTEPVGGDAHAAGVGSGDRDMQLALELSQLSPEEALQLALRQSMSDNASIQSTSAAAAVSPIADSSTLTEDEMLQLALAESLKSTASVLPVAAQAFPSMTEWEEYDEDLMLAIQESLKN